MEILRVPMINANEDELLIADVFVSEGAPVQKGELLFSVESTKASVDVDAPQNGFVRGIRVEEGARAKVGAVLCAITATADEAFSFPEEDTPTTSNTDVQATRKAQKLAEEHGINLAEIDTDGIIRVKDVERLIQKKRPLVVPSFRDQVVILGAGGHARAMVDLIRQSRPDLEIVGAVDDSKNPPADVLGVPVLGSSDRLAALRKQGVRFAALGVGAVTNNKLRIALFEKLVGLGFLMPSFVHPRAVVEPSVHMGQGNQVFGGAIIGSNAKLGHNTIINSGTILSHDCIIHDHAHVTPGAVLAGSVSIGRNSVIGMASSIYLGVKVGENVVISNGKHILADVPDNAFVKA